MEKANETPQPQPAWGPHEICLRKQQVKINHLKNTIESANNEIREEKTKYRYETLKTRIDVQFKAVQEIFDEVMIYQTNSEEEQEIQQDQFYSLEALVDETIDKIQEKINEASQRKPEIPLPKVQIPTFSGGYEEWITFYDIFEKMIHNNTTLSKVEKMHYLKTYTRNEASKLIQHLYITDGNYQTAWDLLCRRYHNKRLIVNNLLTQICECPKIHEENYYKLQRMYNITRECLEAIKNLGIDTDAWGVLIAHLIEIKWDNETNKLYEQSLHNPREVQPLSSVMEFLERRCQSLESFKLNKPAEDGLLAQDSELEVLLSGSIPDRQPTEVLSMVSRVKEYEQITKFWETEEIDAEKPMSSENIDCEIQYEQTTRKSDGKFTEKIPFKQHPPRIEASRSKTLVHFFQLEKKFERDADSRLERGSLHNLMPPAHVNKIIQEAPKKLPPTLKIIVEPIMNTMVKSDELDIHIFSHFLIGEISQRMETPRSNIVNHNIMETVWKEFQPSNTWLSIMSTPQKIALISRGQYQDEILNRTKQNTTWMKIQLHSLIISLFTGLILILILVISSLIYFSWKKRKKNTCRDG